jgi:hypothetical protein
MIGDFDKEGRFMSKPNLLNSQINEKHLLFMICLILYIILLIEEDDIMNSCNKLCNFLKEKSFKLFIESNIPYSGSGIGSSAVFNTTLSSIFIVIYLF